MNNLISTPYWQKLEDARQIAATVQREDEATEGLYLEDAKVFTVISGGKPIGEAIHFYLQGADSHPIMHFFGTDFLATAATEELVAQLTDYAHAIKEVQTPLLS